MLINHNEADLVVRTKRAIEAMNDLVLFVTANPELLSKHVIDLIIEADYVLNSAEDTYINDEPDT